MEILYYFIRDNKVYILFLINKEINIYKYIEC